MSSASTISIHAPTRGATVFLIVLFMTGVNFNPRSHERSDVKYLIVNFALDYFNPRSHERSDTLIACADVFLTISIHAPTRGATAILHKKFVYFYTIPTINI